MNDEPRPGEFELIEEIFAPLAAGFPGAFGLKDDAAVIAPGPGRILVATTDTFIAGRHVPADVGARDFGRRLLRASLSDLAAMGAEPIAYLLALSLPETVSMAWLRGLGEGLAADQHAFGVALAGGNTTATQGPLVATVTALGEAPRNKVLHRFNAAAGDLVYVSGTIGDGALGLMALGGRLDVEDRAKAYLADRYLLPAPRLALGVALRGIASACADISDGLVADLGHICEASGLGGEIRAGDVPLSEAGQAVLDARPDLLTALLAAGDDYELVFTAPPSAARRLARIAEAQAVRLTPVGKMLAGRGVVVRAPSGEALEIGSGGYRHF